MTSREDALSLLGSVLELFDQHVNDNLSVRGHDAAVVGLFSRARTLLDAGRVLIEAHHAEEAMMLGRALYTESLWLMKLDAAGDERARYSLKWSMGSLQSGVKLVKTGLKQGGFTEDQANEALGYITAEQEAIQAYQRKHNIGSLKSFPDEETLAAELGRLRDLQPFLFGHHMVHGSEVSHVWRRELDPETGHYRVAWESHDEAVDAAVAAFLGRSALYSNQATCHIVGWPEPATFDELLAETSRLEEMATNH